VQEHELGHGGNKFGFSCAAQLPWAQGSVIRIPFFSFQFEGDDVI
jgi:hypothetical protein